MRIVQVGAGMLPIPPPDYGAVEKHVWNLTQALEKRGHDVTIVNEVVGQRSQDEYRFGWRAAAKVRELAADIVHVHTPGVAFMLGLRGINRFVFTTHSRHWTTVDGLGERVGFALERRAVRKAAGVIAVSPLVAGELAGLGVRGTVIPNGVDLARYRADRSLRTGDCVVGVGEVARHKQWHVAAAALKGTATRLVLVGPIRDPAYASEVENAAPGQVTLLGPADEADLVRTLAAADVLVHPSVSESFGMAVVEGAASGLPVIASDIVGGLVQHEATGFSVPVSLPERERVAAFRKHLDVLLADAHLRAKFGEAGRHLAEGYSWDAVAERVEAVYKAAATPI